MIRKTLPTAALALAVGLSSPAFAKDVVTNAVYFVNMSFGDGLDTFGDFGNSAVSKGTTFDDVFLFLAPPTQSQVSFFGSADRSKNGSTTFKFTGFDFGVLNYQLTDPSSNVIGINGTSLALDDASFTRLAFVGQSHDFVGSGIYYLEVEGVATAASGGFGGSIFTSAIPEPTNVALLLAGIGLVATMVRRLNQQA